MKRAVAKATGADDEALKLALGWVLDHARNTGLEAAILVPGLRSIDNLAGIIGQEAATQVRKQRLLVINGVQIHVFTPKTRMHGFHGPILVPWANTKMVEEAEEMYPEAIAATTWNEQDLDEWIRAHSPQNLRGGQAANPDPVSDEVKGAVNKLSGISNDIVHPLDKERAVDALKALRAVGRPADPEDVKVIALQKKWSPAAANRLKALAEKIAKGKSVRGGGRMTASRAKKLVAGLPQFSKD